MKCLFRLLFAAMLFFLFNIVSNAQQVVNPWSKWDFLMGSWEGDGKGTPGEAKGWFTLKTDLNNNILVRNNHAEFPATNDRPAAIHDDLMIVYSGLNGSSAKAIYFDNEKHTINYTVTYNESENSIILTSEIQENTPRFRFTYKKIDDRRINTTLEMAPPGKPDSFTVYIEGTAHKKN